MSELQRGLKSRIIAGGRGRCQKATLINSRFGVWLQLPRVEISDEKTLCFELLMRLQARGAKRSLTTLASRGFLAGGPGKKVLGTMESLR